MADDNPRSREFDDVAANDSGSGGNLLETLIGELDWAESPLGPKESWPESLKTAIAMILPADAQIVLFWGPQFIALYNDAFAPTIGDKHLRALGRPAQ